MTAQQVEMVKCDICDEIFDIEQEGFDVDGEIYCSRCEWEYTYTCAVCEETDLRSLQGNLGTALIVDNRDDPINIPDGLYQIIKHPYYGGPLLGETNIFPESVRRIGDVPVDVAMDEYPVGHVCRWCGPRVISLAVAATCWPWMFGAE